MASLTLLVACPASVLAQELTVSAKVDKTAVDVGEPITLVMTFGGDLSGLRLTPPIFPEGVLVAARSQSTNFSIRSGIVEREMSLVYLLVPQRPGAFRLGPFTISHHRDEISTESIDITVKKPSIPPTIRTPQGGRFTL